MGSEAFQGKPKKELTPEEKYKKALRTLHTFEVNQGWNVQGLIRSIKIITEEADPSLIPKPEVEEESKPKEESKKEQVV